jgi:Protein of unknown function (DUF1822)
MGTHDGIEHHSTQDDAIRQVTNSENSQDIEQESLKFPMTTNLPSLANAIQVPLGIDAHRYARAFAAEQTDLAIKQQVYLNTLAVYAVHSYLNWIEIESDLERSDSWNALTRRTGMAADLYLSAAQETIECRPVLPGESQYSLSSELLTHRMGCFPVVFGDRLDYVQLPGFAKLSNYVMLYRSGIPQSKETPDTQTFDLDDCFALEAFPSYQHWWKSAMPRTCAINMPDLLKNRRLLEEHYQAGYSDRPFVLAGVMAGGFESRLIHLKKTLGVPSEARALCKDVHLDGRLFELMIATWCSEGAWTLLLLVRDRYDEPLPSNRGLRLEVKRTNSNNEVLLDEELTKPGRVLLTNENKLIHPLPGDQLEVTIAFDGFQEKLPQLVF